MAAQPASPVPTISPAEMQILISRTGLVLNPGQMADLVLAWRQVAGLIASIPQGRKLADDAAFSFRLPAPSGAVAAGAKVAASRPAEKAATQAAHAGRAAEQPAKDRGRQAAGGAARKAKAAGRPGAASAKAKAAAKPGAAAPKPKSAARPATKPKPRTPARGRASGRR